jgi:hypothetical protein
MAKAAQKATAGTPRDRIIDALMALAAETAWSQITLPMIAAKAAALRTCAMHSPQKAPFSVASPGASTGSCWMAPATTCWANRPATGCSTS